MIEPNWNIFKAKFSGNPQGCFEWFCYLLFCREFNRPLGIQGYVNQRHIENDPIKINQETIGWQAKFYQTPLSDHKTELIKLIEGAKRDYPDITRIIFYTNKNWGQGKDQNDPKTKQDVDRKAEELGIRIDWGHMGNFFISTFVCIDNEPIARHFFTLQESIFDLLDRQKQHTENILHQIKTRIVFNNRPIEIDRNDILEKLSDGASKVLILSGAAGTGKTAIIKKLYESSKAEEAFYIFKATEFELTGISNLFNGFDFQEFVGFHEEQENKTVVVDSAEKLLDLKNTDPFKEFLTALSRSDWRIILTARENYLEDLNSEFFEICDLEIRNINLQRVQEDYLDRISSEHSFSLPENQNLLELIKTPFYLNEYLKFHKKDDGILDYAEFKDKLWNNNIRKSKTSRSESFLRLAFERADKGTFFVVPGGEPSTLDVLDELANDGILGHEEDKGYFITHDIYEEWALEKRINREYSQRSSNKEFFENLGQSLPIRRSFRNWVSEKLLLQDLEIGNFIEEVLADAEIQPFWKDEMLVSVLLSDYSEIFFRNLKNSLLEDEQKLLKKCAFLLELACKEVDKGFFNKIGIRKADLLTLKHVLTRPKGQGWKNLIKFVYENSEVLGTENIGFVIPVIYSWNTNFINGETTRYSSLTALRYYQLAFEEDHYYNRRNYTEIEMLRTILFGASEIKDELKKVFDEVLENKWKNPSNPYHELSEYILTEFPIAPVYQILPESILALADLFWSSDLKQNTPAPGETDIEEFFNIESNETTNCYPPSPYQTPVYGLLSYAFKQTVDFILGFTNKTVEFFAKYGFAEYEIEEIEVTTGEGGTTKQYICDELWCAYRGTRVAPYVLASIHMALEKFFLENGKNSDSKTLESRLLYLLRGSRSASISAVVTSIVLAYPEKTFNVAKVLFQTKEFFLYDTKRYVFDQGHKLSLSMLSSGFDSRTHILERERIEACDDEHRKLRLENLFLMYQFSKSEETSQQQREERQKTLWGILDDYYEKLPPEFLQTDSDEDWRLFLARTDGRKMKPILTKTEKGPIINFNPEVAPELKKKSEDFQKQISEKFKYGGLLAWSQNKLENNEEYKKYERYEQNPELALEEAKEIISKPKPKDESSHLSIDDSIPAKVCSVLLRDYPEEISKEEVSFCKKIVLGTASSFLDPNYRYEVSDGVSSAISVLPYLLKKFPEEKTQAKLILLLALFNKHLTGTNKESSIEAVLRLWEISFDDAQSMLLGYLSLEPKYEELRERLRGENFEKGVYMLHETEIMGKFCEENGKDLEKVVSNELSAINLEDIESLTPSCLRTAFLLTPVATDDQYHKEVIKKILQIFAEKLFPDIPHHRTNEVKHGIRQDFLKRLACFILSAPKEEIRNYLEPFIRKFKNSEVAAKLFQKFIIEQDRLDNYENFWEVWNLFREKVVEVCKDGDNRSYTKEVVKSYLFAYTPWDESITSWHTLKHNDRRFFKEISQEIGHCPSVLYSVSKLLNDVGSQYVDDGILWVSDMLHNNPNLLTDELEEGSVHQMESLARKYIYKNRNKIKESSELKKKVLVLLNFLVEKGSVIGYMLREKVI